MDIFFGNKVQRSSDGLEVNFYAMRNGEPDFPEELRVARTDELKIAVVDVLSNMGNEKLRAHVWCAGGHVFSIEYETSFKAFEQAAQGDWRVHSRIESYPA